MQALAFVSIGYIRQSVRGLDSELFVYLHDVVIGLRLENVRNALSESVQYNGASVFAQPIIRESRVKCSRHNKCNVVGAKCLTSDLFSVECAAPAMGG